MSKYIHKSKKQTSAKQQINYKADQNIGFSHADSVAAIVRKSGVNLSKSTTKWLNLLYFAPTSMDIDFSTDFFHTSDTNVAQSIPFNINILSNFRVQELFRIFDSSEHTMTNSEKTLH